LIGYTNAGKSTIMNALSGSDILVADKLFATLDTTVRRVDLNAHHSLLLSDTVGFIRKLPHHLVASFRTTLSEVVESDLLIHIADISHPNLEENLKVVHHILKDMDLAHKPRILVFNKVDRLKNEGLMKQLSVRFPEALFVSGRRRIGLKALRGRLIDIIESCYETQDIRINCTDGNAEYLIRSLAKVIRKDADDHYLYYTIKYPKENRSKLSAVLEQFQESL
jgi:GTP-binding protein HflX